MTARAKRPTLKDLAGKTVAEVNCNYDGATLYDVYITFTDGTAASFMYQHEPNFEVTMFYDENDDSGKKVKI